MRMYDLIEEKKRGHALSAAELAYMVKGYTGGELPDYQMAAMLMAIYFNGMDDEEITELTLLMAHSGDMVDLSPIEGYKVDKHSTGGVGDKTTLIAGPLAASLGVKVAKMSGRGLGHTGGTVDKLEAIPGFRTELTRTEFFDIVKETGIAVVGQSGNLAPADKKIYALRDVTATVDSIPLIASSIMSKKLAAGSQGIVLDVKTGSGAFMKSLEASVTLAQKMVAIGTGAGREMSALITDMDVPLGRAVGNSLEVIEAVETLKGEGPEDLTQVCLSLAAEMLFHGGKGSVEECRSMAQAALKSGAGLRTFRKMVRAQGGDENCLLDTSLFPSAPYKKKVLSPASGYVAHMDTEGCGVASVLLKAGRSKKGEAIDYSAGILLQKKYADPVEEGEPLAELHASDPSLFAAAEEKLLDSYTFAAKKPEPKKRIYARVTKDKTQYF